MNASGSRDTGSDQPSGGPADRPSGAIDDAESVPSHGEPGQTTPEGGQHRPAFLPSQKVDRYPTNSLEHKGTLPLLLELRLDGGAPPNCATRECDRNARERHESEYGALRGAERRRHRLATAASATFWSIRKARS